MKLHLNLVETCGLVFTVKIRQNALLNTLQRNFDRIGSAGIVKRYNAYIDESFYNDML